MTAVREWALRAPWYYFAVAGPLLALTLIGIAAAVTAALGRGRPLLQPGAAPRSVPMAHARFLRINVVQLCAFGAVKLYLIPRLPNVRWGAPTLADTLLAGAAAVLLTDLAYWGYHRLMHTDFLWRRVHHIHHEVTAPLLASDTYYEHPLDFFIGSVLNLAPLALLPIHIGGLFGAVFAQSLIGIAHHAGRDLPAPLGARGHDLHHQHCFGNYAQNFALFDHLFGTVLRGGASGDHAADPAADARRSLEGRPAG